MKSIYLSLAVLLFVTVLNSFAQSSIAQQDSLVVAMQLFDQGELDNAIEKAQETLRLNPYGAYASATQVLIARVHLAKEQTSEAVIHLHKALDLHPDAMIVAQVHYLLAAVFQKRDDSYAAGIELIHCLNLDPAGEVRELAELKLKELIEGPLAYRIQNLADVAHSKTAVAVLREYVEHHESIPSIGIILQEAKTAEDSSSNRDFLLGVEAALTKYTSLYQEVTRRRLFDFELERQLKAAKTDSLLAQDSTGIDSLAKSIKILDTLDIPLDTLNSERYSIDYATQLAKGDSIHLVVERVSNNEADALLATRSMIREKGIWGLAAKGSEGVVMTSAVEAQSHGIPVILPAQRRPGMFAVGPTTVQPEADWYREGQLAAIYAHDSLALKSYAVVAPATPMGRANAAGFVNILKEREDTELISLEWYFPDENLSLSRQFQRIREIGFKREFADSIFHSPEARDEMFSEDFRDSTLTEAFVDSLEDFNLEIFEDKIDNMWRDYLHEIRLSPAYRKGEIDSNDIQLTTIQAFYFPIEPGTMELFAPQAAFYNFRTLRFGNAAWYNPEQVYKNREYIDNFIITSPFGPDNKEEAYRELQLYTYKINRGVPNIWNMRGYDAATLLLKPLLENREGYATIADGIRALSTINLSSGKVIFSKRERVAQTMWLLSILNGEIQRENPEERRLQIAPWLEVEQSTIENNDGESIDLIEEEQGE
ncbi:hypothetical protein K8I28_15280 [bacterium]|nr:hypothetical protein [bacterium]